MKNWLNQLETAKKTVSDKDSLRTVLYEFKDDTQLEEEYNLVLNIVTQRAWRIKDHVGGQWKWNVELGEPRIDPESYITSSVLSGGVIPPIKEDPTQPQIKKRNTRRMIEWRIRNLFYSSDTYSVICSEEKRIITVKTTNNKYFKILELPELERIGLSPLPKNLSFKYDNKSLVIQYVKPQELIDFDKAVLEMVKNMKPSLDSETNTDEEEATISLDFLNKDEEGAPISLIFINEDDDDEEKPISLDFINEDKDGAPVTLDFFNGDGEEAPMTNNQKIFEL